jgi:hypothetical protein
VQTLISERRAAVSNTYQSRTRKSRKFEVVGGQELAVSLPGKRSA